MHRSLLSAFRLGSASSLARSTRSSSSRYPFSPVIQAPSVGNDTAGLLYSSVHARSCSTHASAQAMSAESPIEEVVMCEESHAMPQDILHFAPRKYIEFTCTICQNRVAKTFSKQAYEKGTVLIRCSGCQNFHLIADHINFTGYAEKTIEEIAAKNGESITTQWDGELIQSAFSRRAK